MSSKPAVKLVVKPKPAPAKAPVKPVAKKAPVKAPTKAKKAKPTKPHHKYWTGGRKNWKKSEAWLKSDECKKLKEKKEKEKK